MALRISVDTGGTFTDVVVVDEQGAFHVGKELTTPQRIFEGMHGALGVVAEQLGAPVRDLLAHSDMLIYGTTRATDAVVTKRTEIRGRLAADKTFAASVSAVWRFFDRHGISFKKNAACRRAGPRRRQNSA